MVAYSFKARFAEPIIAGTKRQTIRADRKHHARPGEALQLYTGMWTRQCRKLLDADPIRTQVAPIRLLFDRTRIVFYSEIEVAEQHYRTLGDQNRFARADGFETIHEMADFWFVNHGFKGQKLFIFTGVLIEWGDR